MLRIPNCNGGTHRQRWISIFGKIEILGDLKDLFASVFQLVLCITLKDLIVRQFVLSIDQRCLTSCWINDILLVLIPKLTKHFGFVKHGIPVRLIFSIFLEISEEL